MTEPDISSYDEEQVKFMVEEFCITVNEKDEVLGQDTKKACHLVANIDQGLLHRAFSCFVFDKNKRLLLQQRATEKITFPDAWTNTCCSHPLYNLPAERNGIQGVKLAAQRKLFHELGIPTEQVPIDDLHYITRIHYLAKDGGVWGEHEVDYILFITIDAPSITPTLNEVRDYKFVDMAEAKALVQQAANGTVKITPWFQLIFNQFLFPWWEKLLANEPIPQDDTIHRL